MSNKIIQTPWKPGKIVIYPQAELIATRTIYGRASKVNAARFQILMDSIFYRIMKKDVDKWQF